MELALNGVMWPARSTDHSSNYRWYVAGAAVPTTAAAVDGRVAVVMIACGGRGRSETICEFVAAAAAATAAAEAAV